MVKIFSPELISRDEAAQRRWKLYFTGIPCRKGHVAQRYVSTRGCKACARPPIAPIPEGMIEYPIIPLAPVGRFTLLDHKHILDTVQAFIDTYAQYRLTNPEPSNE